MQDLKEKAKELTSAEIRLPLDTNGNPRYYIACYLFTDEDGAMYRPPFATAYRGKQYGRGWVFQSYSLESDLFESLKKHEENEKKALKIKNNA